MMLLMMKTMKIKIEAQLEMETSMDNMMVMVIMTVVMMTRMMMMTVMMMMMMMMMSAALSFPAPCDDGVGVSGDRGYGGDDGQNSHALSLLFAELFMLEFNFISPCRIAASALLLVRW